MQTSPVAAKHLGYLDGWRALAALWIVTHHCWRTVEGQLQGVAANTLHVFFYGRVSVDLFIVLSGFCLMLPVINGEGILRGGALQFLVRRAWRILPPYYCAVAFALLLISLLIHQNTGTIWDRSLPVTPKSIVTHLLLLHDAFNEDLKINYVFWSIAVEWRIYFFFPLLVWSWRCLGPLKTTVLAFFGSWILSVLCDRFIGASLTMNYLGLFAGGMLAAAIAFPATESLSRCQKLPWGWITLFATVLVVLLYKKPGLSSLVRDYGVGLWSMSALILTSIKPDAWHHKLLSFRPLTFVGTFSYSVYLVHAPLLQILWQYPYAPLRAHPVWMMAALVLSTPAIIGVCYLFFLLCERPFLQKRKSVAVATIPVLSESTP